MTSGSGSGNGNSFISGLTPPRRKNTASSTTEDSDGGDKKHDSNSPMEDSAELIDSEKSEIVIVLGSFFIMNQARKAIGIKEATDNVEYK